MFKLSFILFLGPILSFGQQVVLPKIFEYRDKSSIHDKNKLKIPQFRAVSIEEHYYKQYDQSRLKEKALERKIKIIYDLDKAQKCKRIGQISTPDRVLASYVQDKNACEVSIRTLMDYANKKGGDTLFISVFPKNCQLGRFQSFALRCK